MRRHSLAGAALALAFLAGTAGAAVRPSPGPEDPRIRWVRYDPDQVVEVAGTLGYQLTIEFGNDERIENVSIGDSLGWQITPNRKANLLFLKPMLPHATTNMTVITSLRRYSFDLGVRRTPPAGQKRDIMFVLRFDYPEPALAVATAAPPPPPTPPRDVNHAYSYEGSTKTIPARVFDDGKSTYFSFAEAADYPAIFILEGPKKESMATTRVRDGFIVVDQIAERFVLRRGDDITTIINDGYRAEGPGPLSPVPHRRRKGQKP
jgi:type IV secretion system protein VirB9